MVRNGASSHKMDYIYELGNSPFGGVFNLNLVDLLQSRDICEVFDLNAPRKYCGRENFTNGYFPTALCGQLCLVSWQRYL